MKLDQYNTFARYLPAGICSLPFIVLSTLFITGEISRFINLIATMSWISNISMPVIFIIFFAQVNRMIGKDYFENKYFKDELEMPTTNYLLFSDDFYSGDYKKQMHTKIKKDFGITLLTKKEETVDIKLARKKITEAVSRIRKFVRKGDLLFQHNTEYGFMRNLIGGSVIGLIFSLLNLYIFQFVFINKSAFVISTVLGIFYLMIILLSKKIITSYGYKYARILFQEYMSKE
jgi:hypothetical protein